MSIFLIKPPSGYRGLNLFSPARPSALIKSLGIYEGSGDAACNAPARNGGPAGVAATLQGGAAWASNALGPYINAGAAGRYVNVWTNGGANWTVSEWTINLVCQFDISGVAQGGTATNGAHTTNNGAAVRKLAAGDVIRAHYVAGGVTYYYEWTTGHGAPAVFTLRGDSRGFYAWMNGVLGTPGVTSGTTMPSQLTNVDLITLTGASWLISRYGATNGLCAYVGSLDAWRVGLEADEMREMFVDPFINGRLRPTHLFADRVVPRMGLRTTSAVSMMAVTAQAMGGATGYFRTRTAAAWTGLAAATPSAGANSAVASTLVEESVTLPTGADAVGVSEWSSDGAAWYAYPGGTLEFLWNVTASRIASPDANWQWDASRERILEVTDPHLNLGTVSGVLTEIPDNVGVDVDGQLLDAATVTLSAAARRTFTCFLACIREAARLGPYRLIILGGDWFYWDSDDTASTSDSTPKKRTFTERTLDIMAPLTKRGPLLARLGNHELSGDKQDYFDRAQWKQALNEFVTFGFNKNVLQNLQSETHTDRLPALDSVGPNGTVFNAAWRSIFVTAAHLTGAERLYGDLKIGAAGADARIALFDSETRSGVGSDLDTNAMDVPTRFSYGATQKAQHVTWAAASSAKWNFGTTHRRPQSSKTGPNVQSESGWYNREARWIPEEYYVSRGVSIPPDSTWLRNFMEQYLDGVFVGHDHWAAAHVDVGVRCFKVPSTGANSHSGDPPVAVPAWNSDSMADDAGFGTAASLGRLKTTGAENNGGHIWSANFLGFMIVSWTATEWKPDYIQAAPMTSTGGGADTIETFARWAARERCVDINGRSYTPSAGAVTLDSAVLLPRRIIGALKVSDLVGNWWENIATLKNQYTAGRAVWAAGDYVAGDVRIPTAGSWYQFVVSSITTGTSGATEPAWVETLGATTTDGGVTWTCELLSRAGKLCFTDHFTGGRSVPVLGAVPVQVFSLPQLIDGNYLPAEIPSLNPSAIARPPRRHRRGR